MTFFTASSSYLQSIAALLIFVAGYLAIILCAILGMIIAGLISGHASVIQAYAVRSDSLDRESDGSRGVPT
jgi:hypothetical protein